MTFPRDSVHVLVVLVRQYKSFPAGMQFLNLSVMMQFVSFKFSVVRVQFVSIFVVVQFDLFSSAGFVQFVYSGVVHTLLYVMREHSSSSPSRGQIKSFSTVMY